MVLVLSSIALDLQTPGVPSLDAMLGWLTSAWLAACTRNRTCSWSCREGKVEATSNPVQAILFMHFHLAP